MDVIVYNRQLAETVEHKVPHVFISISTPKEDGPARLPTNSNTLGVLQLQFYDIDRVWDTRVGGTQPERVVREDVERLMFQPHHAKAILAFVAAHPIASRIIIHCDAGLSRSPGVASALLKIFAGDDNEFFKQHSGLNRRVYRMILDEHFGAVAGETDNGDGHPRDQSR